MVEVPFKLGAGVIDTVRFAPKPPKTMLFVGTSVGFEDPALNCRFGAATWASPMVKSTGPTVALNGVIWFVMIEIVGGVSGVPQSGNRSTSRTVTRPRGSVTVKITR